MIDKDEIIFMINNIDHAADDAQRDMDLLIQRLKPSEADSIAEIAAAHQLKAKMYEGIGGGRSSSEKDMTDIYEIARKTKIGEDMMILQEILAARDRFHRALVFSRIFNQDLTGFQKSILRQKYQEKRKMKAMEWNGRQVTRYEMEKACNEGILRLQSQMEKEGFKN